MSRSDSVPASAVEAFRAGEPVLVHDAADREGEVDLVYPAAAVDPPAVRRMRTDAGGLVCAALGASVCEAFELPFLADEIDHPAADGSRLAYGERSAFSLPVNHRETYTGITDADRAHTITELARAAAAPAETEFAAEFRAPGHVPVLREDEGGLEGRLGHTEFALALARAAGRAPAAVVCEMLAPDGDAARTPASARAYAERNGFVYAEGSELLDAL
jgi:3,4-dihydroxy 2-butanone 4-phosphate synthase